MSFTECLSTLTPRLALRSAQKLDTAVEVLCTLKELLSNIEPAKFLLYPQLLLAAVSLLNSSVVKIGELTMAVLLEVRRIGTQDLTQGGPMRYSIFVRSKGGGHAIMICPSRASLLEVKPPHTLAHATHRPCRTWT